MRFSQRTANLILIFAAILWFAGCLFGCKAVDKYKASPNFAQDCGDKFPPTVKETFIEGETVYDTLPPIYVKVDCDTVTVRDTITNSRTVKVACPPQIIGYKTDTFLIERENTARLFAMQQAYMKDTADRNRKEAQLEKKLGNRTKQRSWLFWILLAIGVGTVLYNRKRIANIFNKIPKI